MLTLDRRCEGCGCTLGTHDRVMCAPCAIVTLDTCLRSPAWLAVRGTMPGDLPGETLADTLRRDRAALAAVGVA